MKTKSLLLISIALFALILNAQTGGTHALVGVEIFNGRGPDFKDMTVIVEKGIIKDIFKKDSKPIADSIDVMYLNDFYLIPGLIDTHVHMGQKTLSQSPEASRKEFRKWVYSGVTAVRDMGGDARALSIENERIKTNNQIGPDIYFSATVASQDMSAKDIRLKRTTQGIGIEKAGYVIEAKPDIDIQESIKKAKESHICGLKFYAGIKSSLIKDITEEAHKQGLKSWAHLTVFPDRPIEVIKAGVDVVSHVWGAFWQDKDVDPSIRIPFTHTDFKGARSAIFPDDLSVLDHDSPELISLFSEMKERGVIWDLNYYVPNPETRKLYRKFAIAAREVGVEFSTGTDYFNDLDESYPSLFVEIEHLVQDGILDTRQALISATLNGAKAIGIEKTHGSIEVGKVANLVVLKKNPIDDIQNLRTIEFTMKNGNIYRRSDY